MKRIILLFPLLAAWQTAFAVDPFRDVVDVRNLPEGKAFRDETLWYRDNYDFILEAGRHEISGATVTGVKMRLAKLLSLVDAAAARDGRNVDLLLFRILLYFDLDGLSLPGEEDYGGKIVSEALLVESMSPGDYRAYWLLGRYYAYNARPLESIRQFQAPVDNLPPESLPSAFWRNYASAAAFADMPKHALEACRRCAALDASYVPEEDPVFRVSNHFRTPSFGEEILPGSLYQFQKRESGFGLLCRLFGIYIPVDKNWGNQSFGVADSSSMLVFTPEPIVTAGGDEITYTITVEYEAGRNAAFEDYLGARLKKYATANEYAEDLGTYPFTVYEVLDPDLYRPAGGFHGLVAFLKRRQPAVKGLAIERPVVSLFNDETGEPYYRPETAFDRYDGDIYYVITLDCCDEIFPEAAEVQKTFIRGMLFD
ncbi:MAG: hypothetical protein JXD23_01870 [Spirochaetales bacterium]|nr:hypothetical protein [Spirochaetales bacterium]